MVINRKTAYYTIIIVIFLTMISLPWLPISDNLMDYILNSLIAFLILTSLFFKLNETIKKDGKVLTFVFFIFLFLVFVLNALIFFFSNEWRIVALYICVLFLICYLVFKKVNKP
jgi:hypothetical protein